MTHCKPLVATFGMFIALSTPAFAETITAEGIGRSASLYAAIVEFCPEHQRVNQELAIKTAKALADAATEALGQTRLDQELRRRREEVATKGAASWCMDLRRLPATGPVFLSTTE